MAYGEFAKIYDELIYEDIDYDCMSNKILGFCNEFKINFEDYLDLACGTGNIAIRVGKAFKNIYAVDLSDDMLREAFNKLKENKIKGRVICQDMIELDLNRQFDLITSVLDSTNYIIEDKGIEEYFKGIYKHLKDDGIFIFDINSYYKLSEVLGNNIYTYNEENVFYTWENIFEDGILSMFLTFFVKKGEMYERFDEEHLERAYKEMEIESYIRKANLTVLGKFNGYSEDNVQATTERIVYIVKKEKVLEV